MARHRNIRAIDVDEEYEGYYSCYGHSVEDEFCMSPQSQAQFLYDRGPEKHSSSFFEMPDSVPEEDDSAEESFNCTETNEYKLNSLDTAKLQSCIEAMENVVGDTISEALLKKAAMENGFDLEKALNAVLSAKLAPKPQRVNNTATQQDVNLKSKSEICLQPLEIKPQKDIEKASTDLNGIFPAKKTNIASKASDCNTVSCEVSASEDTSLNSKNGKVPAKMPDTSIVSQVSNCKSSSCEVSAAEDQRLISKPPRTKPDAAEIFLRERGKEKLLINLIVIGHVDAGKSTLMGHLLFRLGQVSKRAMHKFEQDSKKLGKSSFMYAWVLDETPEERNRGITMDVAQSKFETEHRSVVLLDAPGHKDFIPNMITGAAQADVAILVVDSTRGEFETGFEAGGQTREHTMLVRSLGVSQIAIAVNKMDNINWDEDRYREIKAKMSLFLKQVGFKENDVTFVPCSGLSGENLITSSEAPELKKWYSGPTLVDVIDTFQPPERAVAKPLRMCVSDVFKGTSGGFCVSGKIESGVLKSGDKVLAMPAGEQALVKGISVDDSSFQHCFAGDHIIMQLTGVDVNNISPGSVICDIERPVKVTSVFEARLVIFNIALPITKGFPVVLHYQSLSEQAIIKKLISQLNRSTGEVVKNKPRCLTKNSSAVVEIEVNRPICIELFKEFKDLGRFMLRHSGTTVAAGLITAIKSY